MVNKLTLPAKANDVQSKVNELVDDKQDTLVSGTNIKTINGTSVLGSGNITISTGGTYTAGDGIDITSGVISVDNTVALKTDLPTVNNATLTIQKNGTDVQTFTANASSNVTANITVPTNTNELTNGAGFITGITSSDVTTALGYTPYNSTNPSGYQANVIESIKVNGTAQTITSKAVDITVPTITDTYSATSSDGMSGKAVASAISGKADSSALSDYIAKNGGSAQQTISLTSGTGTTPLGVKSMSNSSYISFSGSSSWLASFGINSSKKPVIYDGSSHTIAYTTDIPTNNNQLTNGAGYITSSALSDYVPTTRTVNSKALSADITLTASDVGALPSSTVIPTVNDATLTITQGGVSKGTFTANANSNATIALDAGAEPDNSTISLNASNKLQTIGVINQRSNDVLKIWQGTEAQWNNGGSSTIWYNWRININVNVSSATLPSSGFWLTPMFGNGTFVTSKTGVAAYSTDNGATWQSSTFPSSGSWHTPTYGNGVFVTIKPSSSNAAYSTDNGATWQSATLPSSSFNKPTFGNGSFVAVSSGNADAAYSTDNGATWQSGGSLPSSGNWTVPAFGNNTFVTSKTGVAAYSTDNGATWQSSTLPSNKSWNEAVFGNGVFVTTINSSGYDDVAYSTDNGATWQSAKLPSTGSWKVAFGNGTFVAIEPGSHVAYSTDNGATWQSATLPSIGSKNWSAPVFGNGVFVTIDQASNGIAYSTDNGATWQSATLSSSGYWNVPAFGNGVFVTSGMVNSSDVQIITIPQQLQCFTSEALPTTSSTVYSEPETASALTVSSVTSGAITLSDNNTYYYNQSGNEYTYESVGVSYPDWLCFINGVGVKIGTTLIATYNGV